MSRHPWTPDVSLDADRAAAVVAARFAALRPVRAAFLANDEWVFRFPMRKGVEASVEKDRRLLPALVPWLPLPVPPIAFVGEPGEDFPWRFLGHPRATGVPADRLDPPPAAWDGIAAQLGPFLMRLHEFPAARTRELGLPTLSPRSHVDLPARMEQAIAQAEGLLDETLLERCRDFAARGGPVVPPFSGEPRFGHHDLAPWHLFLDPMDFRVTAVIDWEDAGLGDPAGDFVGLSMWLGPAFVENVLRR